MKKLLVLFAVSVSLLTSLFAIVPAKAQALTSSEAVCQGAGAASSPDFNQPNSGCASSGTNINSILKWILNILSIIVGIVAVIFVILGGLKIITSNGDSNNVASGKNTILYAIVGLVIVAFAQIIVRFVLTKSSNVINATDQTTLLRTVENVKEFMV